MKNAPRSTSLESIAKHFSINIKNGRVSAAIKLLTEKSEDGILPINDETLKLLHEKHPSAQEPDAIALLPGVIQNVHPSIFDHITADSIQKAASRTKGRAGPSGMDADDWNRILASNKYGQTSSDCREALALLSRTICTEMIEPTTEADGKITSSLVVDCCH